jgi:predicted RNase H-like HicB family nuclease
VEEMTMPPELHIKVRHEDDSYWATVSEFPGVLATGDTLEELRESVQDGIALMLERDDGVLPQVMIAPLDEAPTEMTARSELVFA